MPAERRQGIAALRAAVEGLVERSSIRSAATEIGVSYTALRWFLRGGMPQATTLKQLVRWRSQATGTTPASVEADVRAASTLLGAYLSLDATKTVYSARLERIVKLLLGDLPREKRQQVADAFSEGIELVAQGNADSPPSAGRRRAAQKKPGKPKSRSKK